MAEYVPSKTQFFVNPFTFVPLNDSEKADHYHNAEIYYGDPKLLLTGYLDCALEVKTPLAIPDIESKKLTRCDSGKLEHPEYAFYNLDGNPIIPGSALRGVVRSVYETMTDSCFVTADIDQRFSVRMAAEENFEPGLLINEKGEWSLYKAKRYKVCTSDQRYEIKNEDDPDGKKTIFIPTKYPVIMRKTGEFWEAQIDDRGSGKRYGDKVYFTSGKKMIVKSFLTEAEFEERIKQKKKAMAEADSGDEKAQNKEIIKEAIREGYMFIGEYIYSKKFESIFCKQERVDSQEVSYALDGLKQTLDIYRNSSINQQYVTEKVDYSDEGHLGYPGFERAYENGVIPIWYKEEDGHLYLSMAAIGRKQYYRSMKDFLGEHYSPCTNRTNLCSACLLFGMIAKEKNDKGIGSRVRFGSAGLDSQFKNRNVFFDNPVTLKELGAPRPSYHLFYAEDGKKYDQQDSGIRGRKFYWHHPKAATDPGEYSTTAKTKRNSTMAIVKPGTVFRFKVYFDRIKEGQLQDLKTAIALDDMGQLNHKIGQGKPLGLGSVRIKINRQVIRSFNDDSYVLSITEKPIVQPLSENVKNTLQSVLTYENEKIGTTPICYPYVYFPDERRPIKEDKNIDAGHQWFYQGKRNNRLLPLIMDTKQQLPAYEILLTDGGKSEDIGEIYFPGMEQGD